MKAWWIGGLCLLTVSGRLAVGEEVALQDHPDVKGAIAVVDAWLDAQVDFEDIPGISVGLVVDQDLIWSEGYGQANRSTGRVPDADTIYSICSISKLFTAIGAMQLRDAGKLTLRDPVKDHLPWFEIEEAHTDAGPARIEGLLTHSSGLPRESDFPYWVDTFDFPSRERMIDRVTEQRTLYPADTRFQYSNLALTLVGEIIAARAGMAFDEYMQSRILEPLGLTSTRTYFPIDQHGEDMAMGYAGRERHGERRPLPPFDTAAITPAAGFTSTVNDLARFASWQFRTLAGDDDSVLDGNTLREMHRIHWVEPGGSPTWGLGFSVAESDGQTIVGHSGGCPGYVTNIAIVPKHKIAAIALTNASDGPAYGITNTILKVIGGALAKVDSARDQASESLPDLESYAGNYSTGVWGGERLVRVWGHQLASINVPTDSLNAITMLRHVEGDRFVRLGSDGEPREEVVFLRDAAGNVDGVRSHSSHARRIE